MGSATMGVAAGCGGSLAVAGEVLFYISRSGPTAYSGGIPSSIAAPFGGEKFSGAVAGSDGLKYYVSMEDQAGQRHLFVYDTRQGMWHRRTGATPWGLPLRADYICCSPMARSGGWTARGRGPRRAP